MVQIFSLAALASAALSAAALELDFVRYSRENCVDNYHIRKDVNLHDPHCKTFSDNEPPFSSFKISLDDDKDDLYKKQCYVTVYAGKDCTGASMKYTQLENFQEQCESTNHILGRSVRVSCEDKVVSTTVANVVVPHVSTVGTVSHEVNTVTEHAVTTMIAHQAYPEFTTVAMPVDEWDWCPMEVDTYLDNNDGDKTKRRVKRGEAC